MLPRQSTGPVSRSPCGQDGAGSRCSACAAGMRYRRTHAVLLNLFDSHPRRFAHHRKVHHVRTPASDR